MSGIWHRLTGRYAKVKAQNEHEALDALRRDRGEKDALIVRQLDERQVLQHEVRAQRTAAQDELLQLREDVSRYLALDQRDHEHDHQQHHDRDHDGDDHDPRPPRPRRRRGFER